MGIDDIIAMALSGTSLAWLDHKQMPIELIAAMSGTSSLASDLLRARLHDRTALRRAILLLANLAYKTGKRKRLHLSHDQAKTFAAAAIMELLNPNCRTCGGATLVLENSLKLECPTCGGTGLHRYSDNDRAGHCNTDTAKWRRWERRYEMVICLARAADNAAERIIAKLG